MPISATLVSPHRALEALSAAIADAKGGDALARVTVAVPTNTCGVMTRRALGRSGGVAGVDMVTLNRLAELVAGPRLAAAGRSPVSTPVVDLTIGAILADDPGPYRDVATHPSTVVALRELHAELRLADPDAVEQLRARSVRGRQALRISDAVTDALRRRWYDEADLFDAATDLVTSEDDLGLNHVVLHLPDDLPGRAVRFVRALGARLDVRLVMQATDGIHDGDRSLLDALGVSVPEAATSATAPTPRAIVSTTDADEEVRAATRLVVEAARSGTPFERMAVLWPAQRPYARLVEHHLDTAGIPWNGRPGTTISEHLTPRLILDLLDVDRRGLRRRALFDLLADVPLRDADGEFLPTASWERVSREAGVARADDWNRRLGSLAGSDRWGAAADSLRAFVGELRTDLGHPSTTRSWKEWAMWCTDQIERRFGRSAVDHLSEPEYRAHEALTAALDRLAHLDPVSPPVTRHQFRTTLDAELEATPARRGRVGHGITVGPLAGAAGLDVDVTIVLGAAEGLLPPRPTASPLLSDSDRTLAGLPTADRRAARLHHLLSITLATSATTLIAPRGDLRSTSSVELSRWIASSPVERRVIDSHHAGLASTVFPASDAEHRLRGRAHRIATGEPVDDDGATGDRTVRRGLRLRHGRSSDELTEFDGDLSGIPVPRLDGVVSPSRLEAWAACPHAYFGRYLLDVDPVEEPDDQIRISARDRGTAHHAALDLFHRAVVEGSLPQPGATGWTDVHRRALVEFFDEICERTERRGRTGRAAFWADERSLMLDDLLTWLAHDSDLVVARGSVVLASELRFGTDDDVSITLPDGRPIRLRGSIDRVDRTRDGHLVVTDHKSGGAEKYRNMSPANPTVNGTLFQLPSYAAAARARFGDPTTPVLAEYGLLRKGGYARPGFDVTSEVEALVSASLARIVSGIETGWFPHVPDPPGRYFVTCLYCEPDGLGTVDRWSDWERKRHDPRLAAWFGDDQVMA